jgi:hypothetical protein
MLSLIENGSPEGWEKARNVYRDKVKLLPKSNNI